MRFRFIAAEKATFSVRGCSAARSRCRAGFDAWQGRAPARRAQADERVDMEIAAIHAETRQPYSSPRFTSELIERGRRMSRKRVARLMPTSECCAEDSAAGNWPASVHAF